MTKTNNNEVYSQQYSELDSLPHPSPSERDDAIKIVELLLDNGRTVQTFLGYKRLKKWLPAEWMASNKFRLNTPNTELRTELKETLLELRGLLSKYSVQLKKSEDIRKLCPTEFINELSKLDQSSFETKNRMFKGRISQYIRKFELVELHHVALEGDLAIIRNEFVRALNHKNWVIAQNKLEELLATELGKLALDAAIVSALISNSPPEFIIDLLAQGGKLPRDAIHILAQHGYLKLSTALLPYELDLYYVDPVGMNAIEVLIYRSATYTYSKNKGMMLLFLLHNYIDLKPMDGGLDALNYALMSMDKSFPALMYGRILVDFGMQIEFSHYQQMKII